jgi:L,D-peptidoglycan transpeptidase YkuD (ErfK/YbiS/YcfS/YnhG family)
VRKSLTYLHVRAISDRAVRGSLGIGTLSFPCVIGRGGRSVLKREGDGATPVGAWRCREIYSRFDRHGTPRLKCQPIRRDWGWCDEPADRNYNRLVRLPYKSRSESLWRQDRLYDTIIALDYNFRPRTRGRGSAIFFHLWRDRHAATEGCVAVSPIAMKRILALISKGAVVLISPSLGGTPYALRISPNRPERMSRRSR